MEKGGMDGWKMNGQMGDEWMEGGCINGGWWMDGG